MLAYVRTYGVNASITRGANTYGPNQYPEKLIPLFVTNALDGEPLPVYGDGKQVREWLHVEDHCAGVDLVLREGAPGRDLQHRRRGPREPRGHPSDPRADRRRSVADPPRRGPRRVTTGATRRRHEAARARLGAGALVRREGLPETVDWYRENRAWWEPIKSGEYRRYYEEQYAERLQA